MAKANKAKLTPVADLTPNPENPRRIFDDRMDELKASILEDPAFLWARPLVATSAGVVYAGNQRLRAAIELGMKRVPVVTLDGTPDEIQIRLLRDNQEYGEWETPAVGKMIAGLKERGVDVGLTGFEKGEIESAVAAWRRQERGDPDEIPEVTGKPKSKRGQVYELGPHRVVVGDATDSGDWDAVLGNVRPAMCFTDPPWNVGIGQDQNPRHRQRVGLQNDKVSDQEFRALLDDFAAETVRRLGGDIYCVLGAGQWTMLDLAFREAGYHWSATIIWVKDIFVLGRSKFHKRYEPLWYGWPEKGKSSYRAGRSEDDVWEIDRPKVSEEHPTMKPVALVQKAIECSSDGGDAVVDPFLGAGSTLIACEQTGRVCYGMEIEPKYVDVVRQRYADFVEDQRWAP